MVTAITSQTDAPDMSCEIVECLLKTEIHPSEDIGSHAPPMCCHTDDHQSTMLANPDIRSWLEDFVQKTSSAYFVSDSLVFISDTFNSFRLTEVMQLFWEGESVFRSPLIPSFGPTCDLSRIDKKTLSFSEKGDHICSLQLHIASHKTATDSVGVGQRRVCILTSHQSPESNRDMYGIIAQ
jgi:hypothetical protein